MSNTERFLVGVLCGVVVLLIAALGAVSTILANRTRLRTRLAQQAALEEARLPVFHPRQVPRVQRLNEEAAATGGRQYSLAMGLAPLPTYRPQ
jgi:hypothetical protein